MVNNSSFFQSIMLSLPDSYHAIKGYRLGGIHQNDDKLLNIGPKIKTYRVTKPWLLFLLQTFHMVWLLQSKSIDVMSSLFSLSTQRSMCFFENSWFLSNLLTSIQTRAFLRRRAEYCRICRNGWPLHRTLHKKTTRLCNSISINF